MSFFSNSSTTDPFLWKRTIVILRRFGGTFLVDDLLWILLEFEKSSPENCFFFRLSWLHFNESLERAIYLMRTRRPIFQVILCYRSIIRIDTSTESQSSRMTILGWDYERSVELFDGNHATFSLIFEKVVSWDDWQLRQKYSQAFWSLANKYYIFESWNETSNICRFLDHLVVPF